MTANRLFRRTIALAAFGFAGCLTILSAQAQVAIETAAQAKIAESEPGAANKVAIQVNQNDKAVMDLALNNAKNVVDYYKSKGETVAVEIVTYGPGLHMLHSDMSPASERIAVMPIESPNVKLVACGNTQANRRKAENESVVR